MSDLIVLVLLPVCLSMVLFRLRRERATVWWLSLLAYASAAGLFVAFSTATWPQAAGGLLIYLLPVAVMYVGLRPKLFQRRRWLIPPVGILLYLLGLAVSLSLNVSAGLMQP